MIFAALCAGGSAFIYQADVNPGDGPMSAWFMAGVAGVAACVWAYFVFPKMGRGWFRDVLLIAAAYPCVGGIAGFLIAFGKPVGILVGGYVAFILPWQFPVVVLPIYLTGAAVAFLLPRMFPSD